MEKLDKLIKKKEELEKRLFSEKQILKSFYGGMVGFKKGSSKKKFEAEIDRDLKISKQIDELKKQIDRIENPIKRSISPIVSSDTFSVGDICIEACYGKTVEVIKINKKTVTVKYEGGFVEPLKPSFLKRIR